MSLRLRNSQLPKWDPQFGNRDPPFEIAAIHRDTKQAQ